ncbi:MAG: hypothetical protein ACFFD2_05500 [Promethearchaeota archaeon]
MDFDRLEERIVSLSKYFGKNLIALEPIRQNQDNKLVNTIRNMAIEKMGGAPRLSDSKSFYVGSVDYMVVDYQNQLEFVILEANGGSSRGLLSLSSDQIEMIYNSYKYAIDQSSDAQNKLVLIGHMRLDDLLQEKILLIDYLTHQYKREGLDLKFYNLLTFNPSQKRNEDISVILSSYEDLIQFLDYKNQYITFQGIPLDVIIGDGVARRFPKISSDIRKNIKSLKTSIVNPIYHVTDDKFNTYVAVSLGREILNKYRIHHLKYGKVFNLEQLINTLENLINIYQENFIIKPFGGSGGAGIQPILKKTKREQIPEIIQKSFSEFHQKFDPCRDPFPYTIQEMAKFILIDWQNLKRTFDIRLYLAQKKGKIVPIGGEARIARVPFTGSFAKNEFIVNICGDWGVEFERAVGFTSENLKLLNLSLEDVADMFCSACELFSIISHKYNEILAFNEWNKFL